MQWTKPLPFQKNPNPSVRFMTFWQCETNSCVNWTLFHIQFCLLWRQEKKGIIQVCFYVILRIKIDIYRSLHIKSSKFRYSEKATKIWSIFHSRVLQTYVVNFIPMSKSEKTLGRFWLCGKTRLDRKIVPAAVTHSIKVDKLLEFQGLGNIRIRVGITLQKFYCNKLPISRYTVFFFLKHTKSNGVTTVFIVVLKNPMVAPPCNFFLL